MKEPEYPITSWVGFTNHIKESLGRVLTEDEYHHILKAYIHRKDVDELIEEMKNETL